MNVITFVHAAGESSDHYYFVFHDNPSDEEIHERVNDPEEVGDDAGYVYVEHVERVDVFSWPVGE